MSNLSRAADSPTHSCLLDRSSLQILRSEFAACLLKWEWCLTKFPTFYLTAVYRLDPSCGAANAAHDETAVVPDPLFTTQEEDDQLSNPTIEPHGDQQTQVNPDPSYLTLSQLSPRKREVLAPISATTDPADDGETPTVVNNTAAGTSERPTSPPLPMRTSIKRAGSPVVEPPAHARKRSKTTSGQPAPLASKEPRGRKPALHPSRVKNTPAVATSSGPSGASRTRRVVSATASVASADRAHKIDGANKSGGPPLRSLSKPVPGGEGNTTALTAAHSAQGLSKSSQSTRNAAVPNNPTSRSGHFTRSQRENVPTNEVQASAGQTAGRSTSTATDRLVRSHAVFLSEFFPGGLWFASEGGDRATCHPAASR